MNPESPITPEMQALLDQLHDIVVPDAVPYWPPAAGWWAVSGLLLASLIFVLFVWWRRRKLTLYRREACAELDHLPDLPAPALAQQISAILKRSALTAYPDDRHRIAGLFGADWVRFLNHTCQQPAFSEDSARILAGDCYRAAPAFDATSLRTQAAQWLKHHQRTPPASAFSTKPSQGAVYDRV